MPVWIRYNVTFDHFLAEIGGCYNFWCAGGTKQGGDIVKNKAEAAKMLEMPWQTPEDIEKEKVAQQDHLIMTFFRDYVGPFLMKKPVKVSSKFPTP